jgi:hypothetical protein
MYLLIFEVLSSTVDGRERAWFAESVSSQKIKEERHEIGNARRRQEAV